MYAPENLPWMVPKSSGLALLLCDGGCENGIPSSNIERQHYLLAALGSQLFTCLSTSHIHRSWSPRIVKLVRTMIWSIACQALLGIGAVATISPTVSRIIERAKSGQMSSPVTVHQADKGQMESISSRNLGQMQRSMQSTSYIGCLFASILPRAQLKISIPMPMQYRISITTSCRSGQT